MTSRFLNRKAAAEMLGLAAKTLANWAVEGRGPKVFNPTGGRALYREEDVANFILGIVIEPEQPRRGRPYRNSQRRL